MSGTLVWFRRDLRLQDNPALFYAAEDGPLLPIYILDDQPPKFASPGAASRWWLQRSLMALDAQLKGQLRIFKASPEKLIPALTASTGIRRVVWNRSYEPEQVQRDRRIEIALQKQGISVQSYNASLLWEPCRVLKKDGSPYRVFTPYYRNGCLKQPAPRFPLSAPQRIRPLRNAPEGLTLQDSGLVPRHLWHKRLEAIWRPGEIGAGDVLAKFVQKHLRSYDCGRDLPAKQATSRLSPYLHSGELSPNQVWYSIRNIMEDAGPDKHADRFFSELAWREFGAYLLFHWPQLPAENFQRRFDLFDWKKDQEALHAWQQGLTGIPMVDAGMRELWQTGFMHNRLRMITGSFLVKNLLQDWREGAAWFWETLVDADLASNSAGWQWVAGSGADAAPFFRIFNPVTQGKKFDPDGDYVRRFCPELGRLSSKYIHTPWLAPETVLQRAGIRLGQNYPYPIVDLQQSRQRALDTFTEMKRGGYQP